MRKTVLLLFLAACTGSIDDFGGVEPGPVVGNGHPDGGPVITTPAFELTIDAPAEVPRDELAIDGSWVARVMLRAHASRPATIEWMVGGTMMGSGEELAVELRDDGERTIEAVARDGGTVLGRASAKVEVTAPTAADGCLGALDALGVDYAAGPAAKGIALPVTVTLPLNGIAYRSSGGTARKTLFMDCSLALALYRAAELWKERGVVAVTDLGIYNYRCINQSIPPPCTGTSFSQHAFGNAIDLAIFHRGDGTSLSVNNDFVIDPVDDTCDATPAGSKNVFLHELVCAMYHNEVFKILLTPNYNADHRNHFHVDLTERNGSFIGKGAEVGVDVGLGDD